MIWLKSCPRCVGGDMVLDEDSSKRCLQCGHVEYPPGWGLTDLRLARLLGMDGDEVDAVTGKAIAI